jgi:predicted DsbA family dithiol-disulfide isomerase
LLRRDDVFDDVTTTTFVEFVMERIQFSFDPRCPWCYQTSRWALRLESLGEMELTWSVFSLELNRFNGEDREFDPGRSMSAAALRTSVMVRETEGEAACGRFYAAIGHRYFYLLEDLAQEDTIQNALGDCGLSRDLYVAAMDDSTTWDLVVTEHERVVEEVGAFGVPTLRLDGGRGPGMFGPVIQEVPSDEYARDLLRHVVWLMRNSNFYELKRGRTGYPDLPYVKRALEQRSAGRRS